MTITDKDQRIADLEAEINTLRAIINKMPGNVYWSNLDGVYLGCNQNTATSLGFKSPEEFIGLTVYDFADKVQADELRRNDVEVMTSKEELIIEEHSYADDGSPAIWLSQKLPLFDDKGQVSGMLGISFNITDRKRAEEKLKLAKRKAEEANREKTQFIAMISHELRTPLTSILGFMHFLEQDNLPADKRKQYVQYIIHSGSYLLSLINNILDYSRLKVHKIKLVNSPTEFNKILQDVVNMLSGSAALKNLKILLAADEKIPQYLMCDARVLRQVLVNLVGNAVKFTEKGSIQLEAKLVKSTADAVELQIAIVDTGIGIPLDEQRSVFKKFYQSANIYTRNRSLTGTGLGLAIVKQLVKLLGGEIKVKSIPGEGSVFYFTVKFQKVTSENKDWLEQQTTKSSRPSKIRKYRALLIEDDQLIQIVHKKMLEDLGCEVDIATNANEALEMATHQHDIIFIDLGLPDIDGFELIRVIRKEFNTPMITLTGYSAEEDRQRCLSAGANEMMVKPISITNFEELLNRYTGKS